MVKTRKSSGTNKEPTEAPPQGQRNETTVFEAILAQLKSDGNTVVSLSSRLTRIEFNSETTTDPNRCF